MNSSVVADEGKSLFKKLDAGDVAANSLLNDISIPVRAIKLVTGVDRVDSITGVIICVSPADVIIVIVGGS